VPADLVLANGKVVTMDGVGTIAEAVAVVGERIFRVGARADVEPLVGDRTKQVDLEGRVVVPGFIDTHVHLDCAATHTKLATSFHVPPVDYVEVSESLGSRDAILACIEMKARETPKGGWIIGQGRFSMESDGTSPTRRELDRVAPDHPVMIRYSAHSQLLNGKALAVVGIGGDSPSRAELEDVAPGARILLDLSSGEPTGVIHEGIDWILRMRNPWPHEELKGAIRKTCQEAVR
jgi:predicted amidohydrolase YtcJ